jgi:7,8-didemethyl-8-hydroxy-5-deazariboflavin synthase
VNPDYHHLQLPALATLLASAGWELSPRLPVYPSHEQDLATSLLAYIQAHRQARVG